MQVQQRPQAVPQLAQAGSAGAGKCMQNHAPYGCMADFLKTVGFTGFFRQATVRPVRRVDRGKQCSVQGGEFFTIIILRRREGAKARRREGAKARRSVSDGR